jgi:5-methyltetrahydrofolate--homocysteine methyltransferase
LDSLFLEHIQQRILVFDGATGTNLQSQNLTAADFGGEAYEGCNEYLVFSKPEAVEKVHRGFLEAGADVIETNTFGATSIVLSEYGLGHLAFELNLRAAQIARHLADQFSTGEKPRFVAGSIGPTTKLPSLDHLSFEELRAACSEQIRGLVAGGVDVLCIETCQDLLQVKAAIAAASDCFDELDRRLPIIVSVTMESTGSMLLGTEIAAALTAIEAYDIVSVIGLNCATGPQEMEDHIRTLSQSSRKPVFVMPNAGIPENVGGHTCYRLTPDELAQWMSAYIDEFGVNIIGGCCGTTPEHIKRLVELADGKAPRQRNVEWTPSVSSLYTNVPMRVEPAPVLVGERCNTNGSKQFREYLLADDFDSIVTMAKEQALQGAHILDVCVAYVGRDEVRDMTEVIKRFNTQISAPLMIDSTELPVLEAALQHYGGRAIINSVNLEDGEERVRAVFSLCKKYGAAVVALTIDEDGMAKTAEKKCRIAWRIRELAAREFNLRDEDLIFDMLTFTLGSGDDELRSAGVETLNAIKRIQNELPRCHTSLGVSNISFGLSPHSRHVLNSVFLHHAIEAGLDMAIVHASKIIPLHRIDEKGAELARQLIFDERQFEMPPSP